MSFFVMFLFACWRYCRIETKVGNVDQSGLGFHCISGDGYDFDINGVYFHVQSNVAQASLCFLPFFFFGGALMNRGERKILQLY